MGETGLRPQGGLVQVVELSQSAGKQLPIDDASCKPFGRDERIRQLSPAPDMPPYLLRAAMCQEATYAVQQSKRDYSITSLASASSFAGTSRPSILAVLRLMISSIFVACMTGRSADFSPLRRRPA
jgi:hypothetical protein